MTGWQGQYIRLVQALLIGKLAFPRIHVDGQVIPRLQGDECAMEEDQFWAGNKDKVSTQSLTTRCPDAVSKHMVYLPSQVTKLRTAQILGPWVEWLHLLSLRLFPTWCTHISWMPR